MVENSKDLAMEKVPKVNSNNNTEIKLLKDIIEQQKLNLDKTNDRINSLVNVMEKQDLSKFYDTIIRKNWRDYQKFLIRW